ncbi:MAG: IS3 family transposase [Gammaproteobacteria bacterium]|nr:IS3 family transposase [Gammaproteobacteria bacterium]
MEQFFGSLKHDWLFKVPQPARELMKQGITSYICYFNLDRLHASNGNMPPVQYECSQVNISGLG